MRGNQEQQLFLIEILKQFTEPGEDRPLNSARKCYSISISIIKWTHPRNASLRGATAGLVAIQMYRAAAEIRARANPSIAQSSSSTASCGNDHGLGAQYVLRSPATKSVPGELSSSTLAGLLSQGVTAPHGPTEEDTTHRIQQVLLPCSCCILRSLRTRWLMRLWATDTETCRMPVARLPAYKT